MPMRKCALIIIWQRLSLYVRPISLQTQCMLRHPCEWLGSLRSWADSRNLRISFYILPGSLTIITTPHYSLDAEHPTPEAFGALGLLGV